MSEYHWIRAIRVRRSTRSSIGPARALRAAILVAGTALAVACGGGEATAPAVSPGSGSGSSAAGEPGSPYAAQKQKFVDAYLRKDYATAATEAARAIDLSPAIREPYMLLSKTLIDAGKDEDAARMFGELTRRYSDRPDPWFFLGFHQARLGQWESARQSLERAVALAPADSEARHRLGLAQEQTGRTGEALANLRSAAELDPASPFKASSLMIALHTAGKDAEADAMAAALLARAPASAESRYAVARLRIAQARYADAEAALRECLKISPDYAPAKADLKALQARAGSQRSPAPVR